MSLEIKSVDIRNEEEEYTINIFQSFGWKLKSSQRVYNKSTTVTGADSSGVNLRTETVDFTKLVFERDKNMPNYERIVNLEHSYYKCASILPDKRPEEKELLDFDKWVKINRPSPFSKLKTRIIRCLAFAISYVSLAFLGALFIYKVAQISGENVSFTDALLPYFLYWKDTGHIFIPFFIISLLISFFL